MTSQLIHIASLPPDERKSIEEHARRIPQDWDREKLPRIRIPTRPHWTQMPSGDDSLPRQIEYVEFEIMRVAIGPHEQDYWGSRHGRALVANGFVIVALKPSREAIK